ncbi:loricrin-like [Eucalyptus grandis]|uniref:loricrin-like n=1 Tax=Eucalyptus grandis TaxID=71139 RepID=UPI00192ED9CB|nr:loricrin-like [Eucalyptus grandis]
MTGGWSAAGELAGCGGGGRRELGTGAVRAVGYEIGSSPVFGGASAEGSGIGSSRVGRGRRTVSRRSRAASRRGAASGSVVVGAGTASGGSGVAGFTGGGRDARSWVEVCGRRWCLDGERRWCWCSDEGGVGGGVGWRRTATQGWLGARASGAGARAGGKASNKGVVGWLPRRRR